jgi:hypothetical protein
LHAICETAVKEEMLECNQCQIEQVTNPKPERVAFVPTIAKLEAIADKQEIFSRPVDGVISGDLRCG